MIELSPKDEELFNSENTMGIGIDDIGIKRINSRTTVIGTTTYKYKDRIYETKSMSPASDAMKYYWDEDIKQAFIKFAMKKL